MSKPKHKKSISEYIADRIMRNQMRVKFSTAHADFLEEQYNMSINTRSATTTGLAVNDMRDNRIATQAAAEANAAAQGKKFTANPELSSMGEAFQPAPIVVKPVDFKTITGSYAGDHRAEASPAQLPNQPNPRQQMEGQRDSRNYNENGKAFKSTPTGLDSEAGN